MRNLLKFCYFLIFMVIVSCGDTASKKPKSTDVKDSNLQVEATPVSESKVILFFGNSLTAGMGLNPENAFPALIQKRLDSLQLDYTVVNAGLSGETTSGGKNRLDWVLNQPTAIFVLELGANDGLRGIPLHETRSNLQTIIDMVRKKNPKTQIVLAGMQIPPNMGEAYTSEFRNIFPDLAKKNNAALIPFLLEDVAGVPDLNQTDGIHPTVEGHKILAQNVWDVLKDIVQQE